MQALEHPEHRVDIAMVGKYVDLTESYKSLSEALIHAGIHTRSKVQIHYVDSEAIERDGVGCLGGMDAILVPGGFGKRGVEGKIAAIRYARENGVPYLGICLGMQLAVIEYARHMAGFAGANSTEFDADSPHPVVALITEWQDRDGSIEKRSESFRSRRHHAPGRAALRGATGIAREPHLRRHAGRRAPPSPLRGEQPLPAAPRGRGSGGERPGAQPAAGDLCEMIELADHPWFFGCQFHPEFTSNPRGGHPLFVGFVRAALQRQRGARRRGPAGTARTGHVGLMASPMQLCGFEVGLDRPLFLIAGPCVVESEALQLEVAGRLKEICSGLGVPFIFKSSYDKANRSSAGSFRGPGMQEGLASWPRSSGRSASRC